MPDNVIVNISNIADDAEVGLVWQTIVECSVEAGVSDIHLLAQRDGYELLLRYDGDMLLQGKMSKVLAKPLISHVKVMAEMDVGESRRPTDGHARLEICERPVDLRISTIPSLYGQDMVVRVFDRKVSLLAMDELGMPEDQFNQLKDVIARPQGLILVGGGSGSGKTTTLYAILRELAGRNRKILTIEDPVEYDLNDVNQTQVNPRIGVNFSNMLVAIMRQDPDIIMVGEIRDHETAVTAVRAANTGHLVLATTHAISATRAIEAMLSLGVHPYFLGASLRAVVAQVLVKNICPKCKMELPETIDMLVDPAMLKRMASGVEPRLYMGEGCDECFNTGYRKRMAIFEMFIPDENARQMILDGTSTAKMDEYCKQEGMLSLQQSAKLAAISGHTTLEEVVRTMPMM